MTDQPRYDVVVPTVGRPSLAAMLDGLAAGPGPQPERVVVVDDRRSPSTPLDVPDGVGVIRSGGRGPAAARNAGWMAGSAEWVAFLDDDVVPERGWRQRLADDLACLNHTVGGSQGRLVVPLPQARRPTDWERNVAGLATARWATADMAYRRAALAAVGGFDERFTRAYREDADLGARVVGAGWSIVTGERRSIHPVRPADRWVSVRLQAGNADDALLRAIHGKQWREVTGAPLGRRARHLTITAAAAAAVGCAVTRRPGVAVVGAALAAAGVGELAWARIAPGPRTGDEILAVLATSAAIPPAATWHWLRGWCGLPRRRRLTSRPPRKPAAVLFDRDGTLIVDVPYNGDPSRVVPMPGARQALDRLRAAGVRTGVVSNQSGVGRGILTGEQVEAVNSQVERLLGPLGPWAICPHGPADGCRCRKPAAGLVLHCAAALGVDPHDVAVVGDIGADVAAAEAAGARGILVPTAETLRAEIVAAREVAPDLPSAVERLLGGWR